jgi:hypothetical protein
MHMEAREVVGTVGEPRRFGSSKPLSPEESSRNVQRRHAVYYAYALFVGQW